jgi:hypothetical protein
LWIVSAGRSSSWRKWTTSCYDISSECQLNVMLGVNLEKLSFLHPLLDIFELQNRQQSYIRATNCIDESNFSRAHGQALCWPIARHLVLHILYFIFHLFYHA